ncbi:MAG TPA: hypothetical protein VF791_20970 [Pyrinomonadaceae bacterium]
MSDKDRQKKDGRNKDKKNQAMREAISERKQNAGSARPGDERSKQTGTKSGRS